MGECANCGSTLSEHGLDSTGSNRCYADDHHYHQHKED